MAKKKPNGDEGPKDIFSIEAISKNGDSISLGVFQNAGTLAKIVVYGLKPSTKLVRGGTRNTGGESPLNREQLLHLVELVFRTTKDIKRLAKSKFRHKWNDMDDAMLKKHTYVVRCSKCKRWVNIQSIKEGVCESPWNCRASEAPKKADSPYLSHMPKKVPKGYSYLCHNHIRHDVDTPPINNNGFRAWWTNELVEGFVRCKCGWSGLPHYARS